MRAGSKNSEKGVRADVKAKGNITSIRRRQVMLRISQCRLIRYQIRSKDEPDLIHNVKVSLSTMYEQLQDHFREFIPSFYL